MPRFAPVIKIVLFSMFITFSFRIIVLSIGYYASLGGEDTSQAKDFGIGGVTSLLDRGLDSFSPLPPAPPQLALRHTPTPPPFQLNSQSFANNLKTPSP